MKAVLRGTVGAPMRQIAHIPFVSANGAHGHLKALTYGWSDANSRLMQNTHTSLAYHIQLDHLIQHLRGLPICLLVVTLGHRMPLLKCLQVRRKISATIGDAGI